MQLRAKARGWAKGWARRRHLQPQDEEDVLAAAERGLWESASRFDASRGHPFTAMAWPRIRGAVIDWARRSMRLDGRKAAKLEHAGRPIPRLISLDALMEDPRSAFPEMKGRGFEDALETERQERADRRAELHDWARELIAVACVEDRRVLTERYLEGRTLKAIGQGLGVSDSRASQLLSRALGRLRQIAKRAGVCTSRRPASGERDCAPLAT